MNTNEITGTRNRFTEITIQNPVGKPSVIIFRESVFLEGLAVEVEQPAKIKILDRNDEDAIIDGTAITFKEAVAALRAIRGMIQEPELNVNVAPHKPEQLFP